jgi:hypothetical protein
MELLTALLTGFFAWLWLLHFQRGRRTRAREAAGQLLLEVKVAERVVRRWRWARLIGVAFLLISAGMPIAMYFLLLHAPRPSMCPYPLRLMFYSFTIFVEIAVYFSILLLVAIPMTRSRIAFEIREHGVLYIFGQLRFVPWSGISECRWFRAKTRWRRWSRWGQPPAYKRSCITVVEERIADGQKDAVTAHLSRFAPVYDHVGTLLAGPSEADASARAKLPTANASRFLLQFDLQSLLLLMVVVSCAASCYGVHLRRLQPQWEAVAHLKAAFQPSITDIAGVPVMLDFSKCAVKPTDGDLAYLEPLSELTSLDLSDAPVSDAGLKHLAELTRLDYVNLKGTKVTSKAAAELSRSLPDTEVFFGPANRSYFYGPSCRPKPKAAAGRK